MPGRTGGSESNYRFGYQGQFAEKDYETGYNQFEARLYDPRILRWHVTDPMGQYWSPYLSMGNSWPNTIDPDGMYDRGKMKAYWRSQGMSRQEARQYVRGLIRDFEGPSFMTQLEGEDLAYICHLGNQSEYLYNNPDVLRNTINRFGWNDFTYGLFNGAVAFGTAQARAQAELAISIATAPVAIAGLYELGQGIAQAANASKGVKYIGRLEDLKAIPRSKTFLNDLPNLGSPKANYYQNMSVIRKAVRDGYIIKDASWFRPNSELAPTLLNPNRTVGQTFLGAERLLLNNKGLWP